MISVSPEKLVVKEGDAAEFSCNVEAGRPAPEVNFFLTRHFICVLLFFLFFSCTSFIISSWFGPQHHQAWEVFKCRLVCDAAHVKSQRKLECLCSSRLLLRSFNSLRCASQEFSSMRTKNYFHLWEQKIFSSMRKNIFWIRWDGGEEITRCPTAKTQSKGLPSASAKSQGGEMSINQYVCLRTTKLLNQTSFCHL